MDQSLQLHKFEGADSKMLKGFANSNLKVLKEKICFHNDSCVHRNQSQIVEDEK